MSYWWHHEEHLTSSPLSVLTAIFPGEPGLAGFTGAKNDESCGDK